MFQYNSNVLSACYAIWSLWSRCSALAIVGWMVLHMTICLGQGKLISPQSSGGSICPSRREPRSHIARVKASRAPASKLILRVVEIKINVTFSTLTTQGIKAKKPYECLSPLDFFHEADIVTWDWSHSIFSVRMNLDVNITYKSHVQTIIAYFKLFLWSKMIMKTAECLFKWAVL